MRSARLRQAAVATLIAFVVSLVVASPALDFARGLSIDVLTMLRWRVFGGSDPTASRAVVVAIDEETFRTPPFAGSPSVTWTREIGRVLTAIVEAQASVVGFDVIFPTSIEQSAVPFGDDTLGARVRGFDRDYLRALALAARAGKLVLGEVQHQSEPVLPSPGQRAAVGFAANMRPLNVYTDDDGIVRRLPLSFVVDGERQASFAAELAARASRGSLKIQPPAGAIADTMTLNFAGGANVPTYSLADLHACIDKNDSEFFRRNFAGKIVLIGTVLDVEDRRIASNRFAAGDGVPGERCALAPSQAPTRFARASIPGVFIHATAIDNLLSGTALREFGRSGVAAAAFGLALPMAALTLSTGPALATAMLAVLVLAWTGVATLAFRAGVVLPLIDGAVAPVIAHVAGIAYRFVVADRDRRLLRKSFSLYLTPALIDKMMTSKTLPALGGETRDVTVYFSDLADFSTLSENVSPADLVAAMNEYLSAMTDIIEAHGGFVDKYIGDAIVAVFGAPVADANHAKNGVRAALDCAARLPQLDRVVAGFGGRVVRQRIGINSGPALVGNIGSRRRFNYTVMGDMVNLASRLEGANKYYGTTILASETTVALAKDMFTWREIDTIRVKGRAGALSVFEPLGRAGEVLAERAAQAESYADGLIRFRARDFAGAAAGFARAAGDPAADIFLRRARQFEHVPPPPDWQPVHVLQDK